MTFRGTPHYKVGGLNFSTKPITEYGLPKEDGSKTFSKVYYSKKNNSLLIKLIKEEDDNCYVITNYKNTPQMTVIRVFDAADINPRKISGSYLLSKANIPNLGDCIIIDLKISFL